MPDEYILDSKAPFNMAIATLLSLRNTLDRIRDIEGMIDYPAEERQRIKIELVKRFYVDSSPLIEKETTIKKYEFILDLKPFKYYSVNRMGNKHLRIKFSYELNKELDTCLRDLQLELQKGKYFMPPREDMTMIGGKMG